MKIIAPKLKILLLVGLGVFSICDGQSQTSTGLSEQTSERAVLSSTLNIPNEEYIIVSGGPALIEWEKLRRPEQQHDRWWGNFIRSARIQISNLKKDSNNQINITWLVYKKGYEGRALEDGEPLISHIESVRDKYRINLVWFDDGQEIIDYLNRGKDRNLTKVSGFEYFGHSNKMCLLLDYSNHIIGTARSYLHQRDLSQINRKIFARKVHCKSWGCYSGESFCGAFKKATGKRMIGATGKTDYSKLGDGVLPFLSPGGKWKQ